MKNPSLRKSVVTCRFIGGFQDTRTNKEDFALTPYLFCIWVTGEVIKVRGIGICWGYYAVYLALGWNIPPNYPSFDAFERELNAIIEQEVASKNLVKADVIKSVCPICQFEPMIKVDGKYKCEICDYVEAKTAL